MAHFAKDTLHCSFCDKSGEKVSKLIAGPTVFICNECVEFAMDACDEVPKTEENTLSAEDLLRECPPDGLASDWIKALRGASRNLRKERTVKLNRHMELLRQKSELEAEAANLNDRLAETVSELIALEKDLGLDSETTT